MAIHLSKARNLAIKNAMKIPNENRWKATGQTIGQGGQGKVVAVKDIRGEYEGTYALKLLEAGRPPKVYERFAREVTAIRTINHPSVIRIVDHAASDSDFKFYVMEFLEGAVSLKKLLNTDRNPFHEDALASLRFFEDLVRAIGQWHAKGIVHRDLSPSNVLILPDRSVKVIDFGICQIADAGTITLTDEGVGTQNYMAPECESGAEGQIGFRSDLYSAGKLLWSAVTNLNAVSRESPVFTIKSMRAMLHNVPACWHLHHIFEKTIRHEPDNRWDQIKDVLEMTRRIKYLIASHTPPIELLDETCPLCAFGKLAPFDQSHCVFHNGMARGYIAVKCSYCGFCFARGQNAAQMELTRRAQLL